MNAVALLWALASLSPAQESVELSRTFKVGESLSHRGNLLVTLDMGQIEVNFDLKQSTKRVTDGSGQIAAEVLNVQTLFNGNPMEQAALVRNFSWEFSLDRNNRVVEAGKTTRGVFNQLISTVLMTSVFPGAPFKVGETYKVAWKGEGSSIDGETTLAEVKDGVARLSSKFDWKPAMMEKPAKLTVTSWVDVKGGTIRKLEGSASNLVGPQGIGLQNLSYSLDIKKS